jgi:uncharacterized protein YggU (UPF0235/DUF167 family)
MARIALWVRAKSDSDSLEWDPWRKRWVVSCREPAVEGRANRAVADLVGGWLERPASSVRWVRAGKSPAKLLEVHGITEEECVRRLNLHTSKGSPPEPRVASP